MTDWGMKVSKSGENVLTTADSNLLMSSEFPMFKIKTEGTTDLKFYKTTLSAGINAAVTTIPLTATTGFPSGSLSGTKYIWVYDSVSTTWEAISYTTVTASNVSGGARGYLGSPNTTHPNGAQVVVGYNEFSVSHGLSYPPVHLAAENVSGTKTLMPGIFGAESSTKDVWVDTSKLYIAISYLDFNTTTHTPSGTYDQYDFVYSIMYDSITTPYYDFS
jgi:hypothetical protein